MLFKKIKMNSVKKIFKIKKTSNGYYYGRCPTCNRYNTWYSWCQSCDPQLLIQGWTSGDEIIDDIIKNTQLKATEYDNLYYIQWISYDELRDIEKIGEGSFSTIYKATWLNGRRYTNYDENKRCCEDKIIALKKLYNSQNISNEFLNEVNNLLLLSVFFYFKRIIIIAK